MALTILAIGLLVFFGHFLAGFFERTRVPDVLVLMVAGIVLGPLLGIVEPAQFGRVGDVFATLALIVILFEGGIHLNVRHLTSAAADTLAVSLATLTATILLLALMADVLLPIEFPTALLIGTVLGGTSSAVVVPLIRVLGLGETPTTVLFLESSITDVIVIVLTLGLLQGMAPGATVSGGDLALGVAGSFLGAGIIGLIGAFVWSAVLDRIREIPHTVFTTIAYVFILFGLAEWWGYSGAISALAFGIAVANLPNMPDRLLGKLFTFRLSALADHERAFFAEMVFLVKTFFFVFLGVSMTFRDLRALAVGVALTLAVFGVRAVVMRLLGPKVATRRDAALMTALVPKGLAAAVLASLPVQMGIIGAFAVQNTVYAVIFFSILFCAALIFAIERGSLDTASALWLGKYPVDAEQPRARKTDELPVIRESLILTAQGEIREPHPVLDLDDATHEEPPPS